MSNEFKHLSVGGEMTQAEYEAIGAHVLESQAVGDIIYALSPTQLSRLGIGAENGILNVSSGGVPEWGTTLAGLTLTSPVLNTGVSGTAISTDTALGTSNTLLSTQGAVKSYVDSVATASDLDFQGDTGGALAIDLDAEVLDIAGGTGIDTSGSLNTLTVAIDSTVATLTGVQTLTDKTLTAPVMTAPVLGTIASGVATNLTGTAPSLTAGNVTTNADLTGMVTSSGNAATVVTNASLTGHITSSGNATVLGTGSFTSAHLAGALTNETGTGLAVFNTSPALVTPALGTPASGVLTSTTGYPGDSSLVTTGVLGAGSIGTSFGVINNAAAISGTVLTAATNFTMGSTVVTDGVITDATGLSLAADVTVTGDLTVSGTTTTVDSTVTTYVDPIIHLQTASGGGALGSDSNKDVGLALQYHTGAAAKQAFLGIDDSDSYKLMFIPDATLTSEVVTGAVGTIKANLEGDVTGALTGNADTVTTNANLTGHITSTGNAAVLGSFTLAQLNTAISDDSLGGGGSDMVSTNNLSDVASALTSRTNLGVAIGSDVQAYSAVLAAVVAGTDITIAQGGTGASTATAGFDALSPMTTSGDVVYGGVAGTGTRLAKGANGQVLTLAAGVPSWSSVAATYTDAEAVLAIEAEATLVLSSGMTATGAVLTAPVLGTPVSGDMSNMTGLVNAGVAAGAAIAVSKTALAAGTGMTLATNSLSVDAAQAGITSIYNAALHVGRDADNTIDFTVDNQVRFQISNVLDEIRFIAGGVGHFHGDVYAFSTTTASDRRLKKNIVNLDDSIGKIKQLNGVSYDWKDEKRGSSTGLIAQEVQAILPQLVSEVPNMGGETGTHLTLNYDGIIGLLVEAVKELSEKAGL